MSMQMKKVGRIAKEKSVEISVSTVFSGKRDERQAFVDLILHKRRANAKMELSAVDAATRGRYTGGKVFSDVRVE